MMGDLLQKLADAKAAGWREWIRTEADERAVCEGCWFDIAAAERVRTFFTKYLRHSKGQWAKQPFALMDWQWLQVVAPLFGWKRADGTRRFRRGYIEVPKKNGKALAVDTLIPTPNGWTAMSEIKTGDEVLDENGKRIKVIAATEIMYGHECFLLKFSDGSKIVADADHQWRTGPCSEIRTTREIAALVSRGTREPIYGSQVCVTACEPTPSVPVRCIQVDSPSHLFLAGPGMLPTHNSTLFSGLSLYLLVADHEPGAEVYSAAVDRDQASIVFNEAANMVETSHAFKDRLSVIRSTKRITFLQKHSVYRALSADVPAKEGLNAHAVLIDELHAQKSREMWDTLRYSVASRRQPLHLSITTAGYDRHSICWEQHSYAEQVLLGLIHDSAFFGLIYAASNDDDWTDLMTWRKANPGYGITVIEDQMAEDCQEAQESPAKENAFRRYRLDQWVESETRWLSLEKWDACDGQVADLAGKPCWAGLDLSSTTDLSAFVLVFPIEDHYAVLPFFWVPEEGARRRERRDRAPYVQWIKEGLIQATPGEAVDYDRIRKRINELGQLYSIKQIAIDRWNATQLATQLEGDGFEMVQFGQGYVSMNSPTKKLEQLVLSEQLAHGGNPVLRWMANNVSLETDAADNWKPSKKRSRERIDGIVALIMALGLAEANPTPAVPTWGILI